MTARAMKTRKVTGTGKVTRVARVNNAAAEAARLALEATPKTLARFKKTQERASEKAMRLAQERVTTFEVAVSRRGALRLETLREAQRAAIEAIERLGFTATIVDEYVMKSTGEEEQVGA